MNILKSIIPHEMNHQHQQDVAHQKKRASESKEKAKDAVSRFESSLLELEVILQRHKEKPKDGNTDVASGTN